MNISRGGTIMYEHRVVDGDLPAAGGDMVVRNSRWWGPVRKHAWILLAVLAAGVTIAAMVAERFGLAAFSFALALLASLLGSVLQIGRNVREGKQRRQRSQRAVRQVLALWPAPIKEIDLGDRSVSSLIGIAPSEIVPPDGARSSYVPRTVDRLITEAMELTQLVVVRGLAGSGKSRTAFEAIRSEFGDRPLIVPLPPAPGSGASNESKPLHALLEHADVVDVERPILWLDDIDLYLGKGLVTTGLLDGLSEVFEGLRIVGTVSTRRYERLLRTPGVARITRSIFENRERTEVIELGSGLSRSGEHAFRDQYGPDVALPADDETIGEYFSRARDLRTRFARSEHEQPVAHAAVAAAIDWQRAGMHAGIEYESLRNLLPAYHSGEVRRDGFDEALRWATDADDGPPLLTRDPTLTKRFVAPEVLVDDAASRNEPIPQETADLLVAEATAVDAPSIAAGLGDQGEHQALLRAALEKGAEADVGIAPVAAFQLAQLLRDDGRTHAACEYLDRVVAAEAEELSAVAAVQLGTWRLELADEEAGDERQRQLRMSRAAFERVLDGSQVEDDRCTIILDLARVLCGLGDEVALRQLHERAGRECCEETALEIGWILGNLLFGLHHYDEANRLHDLAIRHGLKQPTDTPRYKFLATQLGRWASDLEHLDGNNAYYALPRSRSLDLGTLDSGAVNHDAVEDFLQGRQVRLSTLFSGRWEEDESRLLRICRRLRRKADENLEERALRGTLQLVWGLATWNPGPGTSTPRSPVLVHRIEMDPVPHSHDFELTLDERDHFKLNPTLATALAENDIEFGDSDVARARDEDPTGVLAAETLFRQLARAVGDTLDDFEVANTLEISNLAYVNLSLSLDLKSTRHEHLDRFADHDLLAAFADDPQAVDLIRRRSRERNEEAPRIDVDDLLACDADSSQISAIKTVLAGADVVIEGPPGTGKSQTIANLIAVLAGSNAEGSDRPMRTLFVAEKKAATDAVIHKLEMLDPPLDDLLLNLGDGSSAVHDLREQIKTSLGFVKRSLPDERDRITRRTYEQSRDRLDAWVEHLHRRHDPWEISYFSAFETMKALPDSASTTCRFDDDQLRSLDGGAFVELREHLRQFAGLGGLRPATGASDRGDGYRRLEGRIRGSGCSELIDELRTRGLDADEAVGVLTYMWHASLVDHLRDEVLEVFDRDTMDQARSDFSEYDVRHLYQNRVQLLRRRNQQYLLADRPESLRGPNPLEIWADNKNRPSPRELLRNHATLLALLKPCWAMSPAGVARLLSLDTFARFFDVVIFDEASQITPSAAIPAVMRSRRIVVSGDTKQLPPTRFFSADREPDGASEYDVDGVARSSTSFESLLHQVRALLPDIDAHTLRWHYRSHHEGLIAFSNLRPELYDGALTTFPGTAIERRLRLERVPYVEGMMRNRQQEIEVVVRVVTDHVRNHPDENLGVIAMGRNHADGLAEALESARIASAEFDEYQRRHEELGYPLFVKNLERVQGDERDAIVLSIGYGKDDENVMRYTMGPLNQAGGERRLNVAVTRARERLTVVASFGGHEMDPRRLRSAGLNLLREYLLYLEEEQAADLGSPDAAGLVGEIARVLDAEGYIVRTGYGSTGGRIDIAIRRGGRMVLAIDCDGDNYAQLPSVRDRDRLRPTHLEQNLRWRYYRIWSQDWYEHRDRVLREIREEVDQECGDLTTAPTRPASDPPVDPAGRRHIAEYSREELVRLVRWFEEGDAEPTGSELLRAVRDHLNYRSNVERASLAIADAIVEVERDRADRRLLAASRRQG